MSDEVPSQSDVRLTIVEPFLFYNESQPSHRHAQGHFVEWVPRM